MSVHRHPRHAPDELELLAYADGRIDGDSAHGREIGAWLETQPAQRHRLREYAQQDRDIRAHYAPHFAAPLPPRLRPAVIRHRAQQRRYRYGALAAAVLVTLAMGWWLTLTPLRDAAMAGFAQDEAQTLQSPSAVEPQPDAQTLVGLPEAIDGAPLIGVDMLEHIDVTQPLEQPLL